MKRVIEVVGMYTWINDIVTIRLSDHFWSDVLLLIYFNGKEQRTAKPVMTTKKKI